MRPSTRETLKATAVPVAFVGFFVVTVLLVWLLAALGANEALTIIIGSAFMASPLLAWLVLKGRATTWSKPPLGYQPMFMIAGLAVIMALVTARSTGFAWLAFLLVAAVFGAAGVGMRRNVRAYLRWKYPDDHAAPERTRGRRPEVRKGRRG